MIYVKVPDEKELLKLKLLSGDFIEIDNKNSCINFFEGIDIVFSLINTDTGQVSTLHFNELVFILNNKCLEELVANAFVFTKSTFGGGSIKESKRMIRVWFLDKFILCNQLNYPLEVTSNKNLGYYKCNSDIYYNNIRIDDCHRNEIIALGSNGHSIITRLYLSVERNVETIQLNLVNYDKVVETVVLTLKDTKDLLNDSIPEAVYLLEHLKELK